MAWQPVNCGRTPSGDPTMGAMPAVQLVIFDCDGVLIDSEAIGNRVLVESARPYGLEMTEPEAMAQFRGGKMADCVAEIEQRIGRSLPQSFVADARARVAEAYERDLRAVDGIERALSRIRLPMCVASNGPTEMIRQALRIVGLLDRFEGRIFSAYEVQCWKPDPGLFLHAARAMSADPSSSVVVEDSVLGVRAAVAAGMRVLGYAPLAHGTGPDLEREGARVFECMNDLPGLLGH
jgi:HAD superfamily hydrolase (TIGR01509 family)